MYGTFGDIVFSGLLGPRDFGTSLRAAYAKHEIIDGKPRLQRTGTDLEQIDMTLAFHVSFCNPQAQLITLERMLRTGEIAPLTLGDGSFYGRYVVEEYNTTIQQQTPNGGLVMVEVQMILTEVANSTDADVRASSFGFAAASSAPYLAPVVAPLDGDAMQVGAAITSTIAESYAVTRLVQEADYDPDLATSNLQRAESAVTRQQNALAGVQAVANDASSFIYSAANDLRTGLGMINGAVSAMRSALSALDLTQALAAMPDYVQSMNELRRLSTPIAVLQAIRA